MSKVRAQGYLDWRVNLKPGYYWIENEGALTGEKVQRIIYVIYIGEPDGLGGYWGGKWYPNGHYILSHQWPNPTAPELFSDWEGFRVEEVKSPSFV